MKTLKKSIITVMLALGCFTTAQAQEYSQPAKGNHIKSAQIPDITQRKGINEGGLKKNDADTDTAISEKKGLNAVNVKLSKTDSSYKDGEDGVSHTRPGNHKPGKSDATTTEDHAINTKGTGATKEGRAMLGLKGTGVTNGHSVDGSDETNPTPQEHAVRTKGSGATTGPDVKPIKVDEIKIGQPHP